MTPRSSGSPVPSSPDRLGHEALAGKRSRERRLRVRKCLRIDGGVYEHADIPQDDPLRTRELGERVPVYLASSLERAQLAQDLEAAAGRLLPASADRVEQLLKGRVGVERERLRRPGPRGSTPACRAG